MYVEISFEIAAIEVPDLRYELEMDRLPVDILALLDKNIEITMATDASSDDYEYLYWKAAITKQPNASSSLAAALRLVWRVHKWTAHRAVKIVGVHAYQ